MLSPVHERLVAQVNEIYFQKPYWFALPVVDSLSKRQVTQRAPWLLDDIAASSMPVFKSSADALTAFDGLCAVTLQERPLSEWLKRAREVGSTAIVLRDAAGAQLDRWEVE